MTEAELIIEQIENYLDSGLWVRMGCVLSRNDFKVIIKALEQQPCEDAISRQKAIEAFQMFREYESNRNNKEWVDRIETVVNQLPSVQPIYNTSEWCHDCKEYDQDKHCCPRFNKVIRNTVEEIKQPRGHWIYEKRKRLINETDEGAEYITDYWCKCSKCGGDFGYRKMEDTFCKYCGARMIEPQAESEVQDADSD